MTPVHVHSQAAGNNPWPEMPPSRETQPRCRSRLGSVLPPLSLRLNRSSSIGSLEAVVERLLVW